MSSTERCAMPLIDMLAIAFYVIFAIGLIVIVPLQVRKFPELKQKYSGNKRVVIGLLAFWPALAVTLALATPRANFNPLLHIIFMALLLLAILVVMMLHRDVKKSRS